MPHNAYISMGSNVRPEENLPRAAAELRTLGRVTFSPVYENAAVDAEGQPDFLNAAARLETTKTFEQLRELLRDIEEKLGRPRDGNRSRPRTIDLDVALHGETVSEDLVTRAFIAVPVADLQPDLEHPSTREPMKSIAKKLAVNDVLILRKDVVL